MTLSLEQNRQAWATRAGRTAHADDWAPMPPQAMFLEASCFEVLYGGAAGGGKTDAGLVFLGAGVGQGAGSAYQALFLRRTYPELEKAAIGRARELYPRLGGVEREGGTEWRFPAGEVIRLEHCEHEKDVTRYQGAAFTRVFFDELTTFTERQYLYLFSRIRSAAGSWCGIRASSNPGGIGHEWVKRRFLDWVSRKSTRPAGPGEVRYFVKVGDDEREAPRGTQHALGRSFVPAKLDDNPALEQNDPQYRARIMAMSRLEREQLLGGDWDAAPAAKDYWDRAKCGRLTAIPPRQDVVARARGWDFGATVGGDPTAGVRLARLHSGRIVVEHVEHLQGGPDKVDAALERVAAADHIIDPRTVQVIPQDPGAAGKFVVADVQRRLARFPIKVTRPTGDKATRFKPLSSRQLAGFVDVVNDGTWDVDGFHAELEGFPGGSHDDRADGAGDAYNEIAVKNAASYTEAASAFTGLERRF